MERTIDFLKYKFVAIGLSLGLFILFSVTNYISGGVNWAIDFNGGVKVVAKFEKGVDAAKIRTVLSENKINASVQSLGKEEENQYVIGTKLLSENESPDKSNERIQSALKKAFTKFEIASVETVGPAVGSSLKKSAIYSVIVVFILMMVYLAFRFEFKYAVGAIVAIIHDCILTFAFCGFMRIEVNMGVISAILTLAGYSVNDTIVIFDRIRENINIQSKQTFVELINKSMSQMLGRTIITSVLTLFTVVAIYIFGNESLESFSLTLIFGFIVGCYSTIYIASPVVLWWEKLRSK